MTDDRSLERAARSFIEAGPTQAPDRAVEAALLRIQTTNQERDWHVPWRTPSMTPTTRLLAGIAAIAVILVGGLLLFRPGANQQTGGPGPSGPGRGVGAARVRGEPRVGRLSGRKRLGRAREPGDAGVAQLIVDARIPEVQGSRFPRKRGGLRRPARRVVHGESVAR